MAETMTTRKTDAAATIKPHRINRSRSKETPDSQFQFSKGTGSDSTANRQFPFILLSISSFSIPAAFSCVRASSSSRHFSTCTNTILYNKKTHQWSQDPFIAYPIHFILLSVQQRSQRFSQHIFGVQRGNRSIRSRSFSF